MLRRGSSRWGGWREATPPINVTVSKAIGGGAGDKRTLGTKSNLGLWDRVRLGWGRGGVGRLCLCFFFFTCLVFEKMNEGQPMFDF